MSLTSYRAAPPRVTSVNPEGICRDRANSKEFASLLVQIPWGLRLCRYSAKQKDRLKRPFDIGRADCVLRRLRVF